MYDEFSIVFNLLCSFLNGTNVIVVSSTIAILNA